MASQFSVPTRCFHTLPKGCRLATAIPHAVLRLKGAFSLLTRFAIRVRYAAGIVLRYLSHRHDMRRRDVGASLLR